MIERSFTVKVKDGLHARPATQFVKLAKTFQSNIDIKCNARMASAKSAVKLMLLGIKENDEVTLSIEGSDAIEALSALSTFLQTPGEGDIALDNTVPTAPNLATAPIVQNNDQTASYEKGIAASEGTAYGEVFAFFPPILDIKPYSVDNIDDEIKFYHLKLQQLIEAFAKNKSRQDVSKDTSSIIDALIDVAQDSDFVEQVEDLIRQGQDAASAVMSIGKQLSDNFETMEDPYIRARAEDIRSVTRQIVLALKSMSDISLKDLKPGSIIVADEITAWDLAKAKISDIGGIICKKGAATSHIAIMARAYAIPAVLGVSTPESILKNTKHAGIDGSQGKIFLDPSPNIIGELKRSIADEISERKALEAYRNIKPCTLSGKPIEVAANLGSLNEIPKALEVGAMGVGLFRTEFLFMESTPLPSEDMQSAIYTQLAQSFSPYPVVIRTLDIGGDKPIAGVDFEHEDNPFLGWRGVRMCLERPDIFKPQLRALLRAATVGNIKILLPMISDVGEVETCKKLLDECREELKLQNIPFGDFELGVMIETPAAVMLAAELAQNVDFFSIGTNDLTQYIMAADRLNPKVTHLNRTEHPAVLAAIKMACQAANMANIWIGVCGEAAARPDLIPFFIANGVKELSMSSASISRAKKIIMEC